MPSLRAEARRIIQVVLNWSRGGMGERLKPAVLKTVSRESGTGVQIPLPPPDYILRFQLVDALPSRVYLACTLRFGKRQRIGCP